jgi:long-subunit fatty acid transport protein
MTHQSFFVWVIVTGGMPRLLLLLGLLTTVAHASAADVFGLGSEESGVGGASAARVRDFSAGFYDPAALTEVRGTEGSIGALGFGARLTVKASTGEQRRGIVDPWGIIIGTATPIPFRGVLENRLYIGLALYISSDTIVRVTAHEPTEAFFPLYDNRTQRLIVLPALAARLWRGVSIGIGFNYLAALDGRVAGQEGSARAVEARVDEQIKSELSVNVGLRWQINPAWSVAAVYRQEFSVPFKTVSKNDVAGQPIDLDIDAEGLYTPHTVVVGAAWRVRHFVASLDVSWAHWSGWRGPYVTVNGTLPLVGAIHSTPPPANFDDAGGFRAGLEWTKELRKLDVKLRGGYGFESSPAPTQQPDTLLLDGHKHRLALGLGLAGRVNTIHLRFDVHGQMDLLQPVTLTPSRTEGSGFAWAAGCTLTVQK